MRSSSVTSPSGEADDVRAWQEEVEGIEARVGACLKFDCVSASVSVYAATSTDFVADLISERPICSRFSTGQSESPARLQELGERQCRQEWRAQQPQSKRDPFLTTVVTSSSSLLYAGCINKSSAVIRVLELFSAGNK
jgi:hypothetical protein